MNQESAKKVACLFVETNGVYFDISDVDAWDKERDATKYKGSLPVVAHPPCQLWGRFAKINYIRWGGEHNKPGNDNGMFASALKNVIRCGGVLEHPKSSYAFAAHGIKEPSGIGWQIIGANTWVCEVWQSAYGHKAAKATWLFYCGDNAPLELDWSRRKGTHQIGFHDQRGKSANKPTISGKNASRTPVLFADVLIKLAMNSRAKQVFEKQCV